GALNVKHPYTPPEPPNLSNQLSHSLDSLACVSLPANWGIKSHTLSFLNTFASCSKTELISHKYKKKLQAVTLSSCSCKWMNADNAAGISVMGSMKRESQRKIRCFSRRERTESENFSFHLPLANGKSDAESLIAPATADVTTSFISPIVPQFDLALFAYKELPSNEKIRQRRTRRAKIND
ncbi:hypothetical protein CEXT_524271, partial [Caerostris extrusa]